MKSFFSILFLALFSICFYSASAQNVYAPAIWETFDGKKVEGFVKNQIKLGKIISVKISEDDKPVDKTADEIKVIYQDNFPVIYSYIVLHGGEKQNIFIELIRKGENSSLYKGKDEFLGKIYAVHKNNQFTLLNEKSDLASSYSFLYGDCQNFDLNRKFVFTEKSIVDAFNSYNQCKGFDIAENNNPRKRWKPSWYIGPKLGYTYGNIKLAEDSYLDRGDYSPFTSPKFGLAGKMDLPDKFNIQLDLSYYKKNSSSDSVNTWPAFYPEVYSTVEFDLTLLDFQFVANYSFLNTKSFGAEIGVGLSYGMLLNGNYIQEEIDPIGEGIGPAKVDFSDSRDIGFIGNLGFTYFTASHNELKLILRYILTDMNTKINYGPDTIIRYGNYQMNSSMVEFSIYYLFKL